MDEFSLFKPLCVDLLKSPTVEKINNIKLLVDRCNGDTIDKLQEYILFPLFIITSSSSTRNERTMLAVGECLQAVCQKSCVKVYKIFGDFLLQLLLLIHDVQPSRIDKSEPSEELKLSAVQSISALLCSATASVMQEFFTAPNKPLLGHLIFTLLKVVASEEMKELRLSALSCLQDVSSKPVESIATCLAGFFPGICTHMLKTINGSVKQPYVVSQNGIRVFTHFVSLIMSDQRLCDDQQSEEWLQQTRNNLHPILEKILNNPEMHWKVKVEQVFMIERLLANCHTTLEPSLPVLIKKLVQYTADERPEVKEEALKAICQLDKSQVKFDSAVRQNLYDVVTCLPRIVSQGITRDQLLILQELQGHLTLLGSRLDQTLIFSGLRHRLFKGLLISVALEPVKVSLRDEFYSLQYLREDPVVEAFGACCSAIGHYGNLGDTADYLLDVLRQKATHRSESVYVMISVIKGASVGISVLTSVILEYSRFLTSLENNKDDVILGQLLLQAIGDIALRMGGELASVLLTILRPVLEKAGHPSFTQAGVVALQSMAKAMGLTSASALLEQNADYFAPQLSFQLRNIARYPRAIDLLRALLLLSDLRMDIWLERMVRQAIKGLDKCHAVRALPYVQVLELYCRAAYKARPPGPACAKPLARDKETILEEESRRLAEYEAFVQATEQEVEDDDDVGPMEEEPEEPEWVEEPVPPQLALVADIMDRCTQLLPQSQDEQLYSSIMETLNLSIDVLWSRENLFLPKVHLLWEPLRNQLFSSSPLKKRQALGILSLLIHRCPDFVRHRVVTEAMPKLVAYLEEQSRASRGRSLRAHVASQEYKLQKSVLSEMASLVEFLDPPADKVDDVIRAVCMYLNRRQVPELQSLGKENLAVIARYHSDAVRSALRSLMGNSKEKSADDTCDYSRNVEELLGLIPTLC